MIIKPSIRSNIFTNSHPLGCKRYVQQLIDEAKQLENFKGPKKVLIIGGSSGYGLSSRVTLAVNGGADTINVSFESKPKGERTGSAGWWNNLYFQEAMKTDKTMHLDFVGDAFSDEMKAQVIQTIQKKFGPLDLIVYSLAAGARLDTKTGNLVRSSLKSIGEPVTGKTIDIGEMLIKDVTVTPATQQEIDDTVFVMGGSDWFNWVKLLADAKLLKPGAKAISYTYIGSQNNAKIYREGTIGRAKDDLERYGREIDTLLKQKVGGEGLISVSKAVVTKASVFIPRIAFYVSTMFEVMRLKGTHESTLQHKHRLFKDMVYGNKRIVDAQKRLRVDHLEMAPETQQAIDQLSLQYQDESIFNLTGTQMFIDEFYQIHGFKISGVDYDQDVDMNSLSLLDPQS
jgi:enoyl-[acyl-carrier protein] reductase / trans-2-enoyl-CoA reductase (NAD+)